MKHLVHITAFKEDIYTIQKYSTPLCVCVAEWKDLLFSGGSSSGRVLAVRERNGALMDHIDRMLE